MTKITINQVSNFPALHCAHCKAGLSEGFAWEDGETIHSDMTPDNCHPSILWGDCPQCGETNFCLDISVVPDTPPGCHLFNDHSHKTNSVSYHTMTADDLDVQWSLEHYTDVSGVTFHSAEKAHNEPLVEDCQWLDIHYIGSFTAPDVKEAIDHIGKELFEKLLPDIQDTNWGN